MAKRFLTWHIEGTLEAKTGIGPAYWLETDYEPVSVFMSIGGQAVTSRPDDNSTQLIVDINDDGTSIFSTRPQMTEGAVSDVEDSIFSGSTLAAESEITLDIDQVGSLQQGETLTVQLVLEEV